MTRRLCVKSLVVKEHIDTTQLCPRSCAALISITDLHNSDNQAFPLSVACASGPTVVEIESVL